MKCTVCRRWRRCEVSSLFRYRVLLHVNHPGETICALSSAPGRAGVAVVRVSGPLARGCLERMAGGVPETRRATLRTLRDPGRGTGRDPETGQDIDRAIVLFYAGPSSFTGEDVVEILLHGGRAVVARVLAVLMGLGCRLAEPGEFARRAFDNGKIDLVEAEGIADLIDAETEAQRRQAVAQAGGVLSRLYDNWREQLIGAMAFTEAAIDFSDEADVAADAMQQARSLVVELSQRIDAHVRDGRRGEILREGFRVVLSGPPNAGKSSLLNALAQRDAAIVSPEPGTTRDVIEVRLDLEGLPVIVSDTAGLRAAAGAVEAEGIRRTLARGREADLVVWVIDAMTPVWDVPAEFADASLVERVLNKSDIAAARVLVGEDTRARGVLLISASSGEGLPALVERIAALARDKIAPDDGPVITQARHRAALEDCAKCLQDHLRQSVLMPELGAEDLRLAANALGRITGRVDAEDVLDQVFGRFCIGK
jgi:tRNA modification GTPase